MITDRAMEYNHLEPFINKASAFFFPQLERIGVSPEEYTKKLCDKGTIAFVEGENGEIIGILAGYTHDTVDNLSYLTQGYVLPEYRGHGIYHVLLNEYIEYCKQVGLDGVWLTVRKENQNAQRVYKHVGFQLDEYNSEVLNKYIIRFARDEVKK